MSCLRDLPQRETVAGSDRIALQLARACAFRVVCQFIVSFDTPAKIVLQVYVALLRWTTEDARVAGACLDALDILLPALPVRLPLGQNVYPTWFKWLRKVIEDDGASSRAVLLRCWSHVTRHPHVYCEQIMHTMWFAQPAFHAAQKIACGQRREGAACDTLPDPRPPSGEVLEVGLGQRLMRMATPPIACRYTPLPPHWPVQAFLHVAEKGAVYFVTVRC